MRDSKRNEASKSSGRVFNGYRFMMTNYLLGAAIGIIFTAAILVTDSGGLWTLIAGDSTPWLPVVLLTAGMALTFAALYAGVSVMLTFRGTRRDDLE